jgi:hypothetical protein
MATVHAGILGVHQVRRHLLAVALGIAVLAAAMSPLPAVLDAVTGAPAGNANLVNPAFYLLLAPLSNILDALTFLSLDRAKALLVTWVVVLALVGALRSGSPRRRGGGGRGGGGGLRSKTRSDHGTRSSGTWTCCTGVTT